MSTPSADRAHESSPAIEAFIARWQNSGAAERANYQMFLAELCDVLGVPRPEPATAAGSQDKYRFDYPVTRKRLDGASTTGWADLYKAGHFVLESKQGTFAKAGAGEAQLLLLDPGVATTAPRVGHGARGTAAFDRLLTRAYNQARDYVTCLPVEHGRPPFLIVCDVGHTLDLYAEFSGTGGHYERFPDPASYRITLEQLRDPQIRERLRLVWMDPHALNPARHAAEVTRQVAAVLAELAKSLERDGHDAQTTAGFLQRCLFTMFAEDIGLLPQDGFYSLLLSVKDRPQGFPVMLQSLWRDMALGAEFSVILRQAVPHFNGGLFEDTTALPLSPEQIVHLIHAAKSDWSAVEPAIFGTLLERALNPRERHKLGAHYTPRSYVERLVRPTIIEPLRTEWEAVHIAADQLYTTGKRKEACQVVEDFHHKLCKLRILDPACGTGNFLYVTLELLKRLEAEVLAALLELGGSRTVEMELDSFKVRPDQFLGLEINPRAVAIAQLVLWIGYFQWQKRTAGKADTGERPLLPRRPTIRQQDAVLAYDDCVMRTDPETGQPITIWDGHTTRPHPVTGKEVPDETARIPLYDYINPRRAEWPVADYIVGNPPFIGAKYMRDALGDGYTETLRKTWKGAVPESADFVMFWWRKAAELLRDGQAQRFGFITTNSIHQTFNRRVLEPFLADEKKPIHLDFAIPDHPWVDSADGAAVRISMTVAAPGNGEGTLARVIEERAIEEGEHEVQLNEKSGLLSANIRIGADISSTLVLLANKSISCPGVKLHGAGFIISAKEASALGLGVLPGIEQHIREYRNGRDITSSPRGVMVIDLYGLTSSQAESRYPSLFQHVLTHVKPERDQNNRETYKKNWWIFGEPRGDFRPALSDTKRYIVTPVTSRFRCFVFLDQQILPDDALMCFASPTAADLAILSSSLHVCWALATGGTLEDRPRYNKTSCFETYPFPALEDGPLKERLRDLGERLDAHRKARQGAHPDLTLTGMYNVLEKLRLDEGKPLSDKERAIHEAGLVSILKQIHDDIDAAVLEAYGWQDLAAGSPLPIADRIARGDEALEQAILTRLVELNHERAEEEKRGHIRWLRPEYQAPALQGEGAASAPAPEQTELDVEIEAPAQGPAAAAAAAAKGAAILAWPAKLPEQVILIRQLLTAQPAATPEELSARFGRKSQKRAGEIAQILATLGALGQLG